MDEVEWDEIEGCVGEMCKVYVDEEPGLRWGKRAHEALQKAGLTRYDDEPGRCLVLIRYVVVARLYHEFMSCMGYGSPSPYSYLAEELLADEEFELGRLFERIVGACDVADELDACCEIALAVRDEVHAALVAHFGDCTQLYLRLYECGPDGNAFDVEEQIAFQWVSDGCPDNQP